MNKTNSKPNEELNVPLLSPNNETTTTNTETPSFYGTHINIRILCIFSFLFHFGWCIWERNLFPVWVVLELQSNNNTNNTMLNLDPKQALGLIQSVQGVTALIVGPIVGTLIDSIHTNRSFRTFQLFIVTEGCVALSAVGFAIFYTKLDYVLFVSMCLWGMLLSSQGILVETIIARSTQKGDERTFAFTIKSTFWRLGNAAAQILNLALIYSWGDEWNVDVIRRILLIGICIMFVPTILLLFIKPMVEKTDDDDDGDNDDDSSDDNDDDNDNENESSLSSYRCCCLTPPFVIFVAVLLRVTGKGMSMKFIPVFFQEQFDLSPSSLTYLVLIAQIISVFSPFCCLILSKKIGRAQTMVAVRLIEPVCLVLLGWSNNIYVCSAAFVIFLGVPIGSRSIEKAVLMDYVHKKKRGRWNALETINRGTWAGSAYIGGTLAALGWKYVFSTAGGFVACSVVVLSGLFGMVR